MSSATTTFIAKGKANNTGEITEIKMIVDMEAKTEFKRITGEDINTIPNEGKSTTNNNIIFVTTKEATSVGKFLDGDSDLIAQGKTLETKYTDNDNTGGERRSRRSNHSKRAGRKQRNKSRRI
jgi:hypothetical protein